MRPKKNRARLPWLEAEARRRIVTRRYIAPGSWRGEHRDRWFSTSAALSMRERRADPQGLPAPWASYTPPASRWCAITVSTAQRSSARWRRRGTSRAAGGGEAALSPAGGAGQRGYVPPGVEAAKGAAKVDLKEFWHRPRTAGGHRYWPFMPHTCGRGAPFRADVYALCAAPMRWAGAVAPIAFHLACGRVLRRRHATALRCACCTIRRRRPIPTACARKRTRHQRHHAAARCRRRAAAADARVCVDVNPPDGRWSHVGDMLQRLTNHVLPSTTHRVVNPAFERAQSAALLDPVLPALRAGLSDRDLPGCTRRTPERYPEPITAQDFVRVAAEIRLA